jgi:hypothetical protein
MRRFTRLTNAHTEKLENHAYAVALHITFYNFLRRHQILRTSPAMAADVSDRLWDMADIMALIDASAAPANRGPHKKRAANSN